MKHVATTYRLINKKLQSQYREPSWGWGFRLAIAVTVPLLWGYFTNRPLEAEWMSLAAECISFIDLKGNVGQRIRLLIGAAALSLLFCVLGSVAGIVFWVSIGGMFVVGFLAGLFKNLGDRGVGLALSVYIFYIICCAYPTATLAELADRCRWVGIGAAWAVVTGLGSFLFIKTGAPYRKTIANIWAAVAGLAEVSGKGWDGRSLKSSIRDIYLKEKAVRTAINDSIYLFETTTDVNVKSSVGEHALMQSRKSASLVSLYIIQIAENAELLSKQKFGRQFEVQVFSLFRVLQQIGERMEAYLATLSRQERQLVASRVERLLKISELLLEAPETQSPVTEELMRRINFLNGRVVKLVRHAVGLLEQYEEPRVYNGYSFAQTISILHPKYLKTNVRQLFNFNSFTTRYAMRIGISTMVAMIFAHIFFPDHGYWIPYTTIIVAQPYFGATLKKGLDRSLGTIAGIIVGSLFLQLPFPAIARIVLVFVSSVFLIYYLRKKYSVAAFFITLTLVGLLGMEPHFETSLLTIRMVCTIIGSALAIVSGFVLLPNWDKSALPKFLAEAFTANIDYFRNTFYYQQDASWVRFKRLSETKNSNAFDSLLRLKEEPGIRKKKGNKDNYFLLMHNVRITRELNNFNSESELDEQKIPVRDHEKYVQLLYECDDLFRDIASALRKSGNQYLETRYLHTFPEQGLSAARPTDAQQVYIEKLLIELKLIARLIQKKP